MRDFTEHNNSRKKIEQNNFSKHSLEKLINHSLNFHLKGNISTAAGLYRNLINHGVEDHRIFSNYGKILKDLGNFKKAELYTRKGIELNPNFIDGYFNLGDILRNLGQSREAELYICKGIELNPNFTDGYFYLFRHYELTNNLKKLEKSLNEFNNIKNIENEIMLFRSRLCFRNKNYITAQKLIDNISDQWINKSKKNIKRIFWNYRGFIEDKIGNYDIAYSYFEKSKDNPLRSKSNKNLFLDKINSYKKSILNKKIFNNLNDGIEESNLCFLIGFPRSGTTLLDTILRSHNNIDVIEERPLIATIEKLIKEDLNIELEDFYSISEDKIYILRKKYFELLFKYKIKNVDLIVDKLPLNIISLPLINLIFPDAKIIFNHRHPYDTVLSCFQQYFKLNSAMKNFSSLESSSIIFDKVMNSWDIYKNELPINYRTSKYEDLIENFDSHILKIFQFLGVEWDENVKRYKETA